MNPARAQEDVSTRDEQRRVTDASIQAFFDRWDLYQRLIDYDYMAHRGIHAALRESLSLRKDAFSVLDLGCGDGSLIAATLRGLPVISYTGVDLSPVALDLGRKRSGDSPFECRFIQANLVDYLVRSAEDKIDVIVAGFTLHHLRNEKKRKVFNDCSSKLSAGGDFYLFDVFCRPGQPREEYLDSYCGNLESSWLELSMEERDDICVHIRENDFPTSYDMISVFAQDAGFASRDQPLFEDRLNFHRLYQFTLTNGGKEVSSDRRGA